uniref:Uncharacterized protein n=1 Tax=Tanacetum cinerariifolium TaxID=118510 RepID=A0A6L2K539_TANCI|nr:hypothetical protein [Tanacetum cinerariifolium]
MDMTIDQQVALDEALVPHASRLRIEKSDFCLRSDISSKESTLQLVYDVMHNGEIRTLVDVNINKLHQPWRSFAAIINKCLSEDSTGYDSLSDEEDDDDVDEGSDDQDDDDDDQDDDNQDDDDDQDEGNDDDQDSDKEGEEFIHPKLSIHDEEETKEEESFDPIAKMPENSNDEDVHTTQEYEDSHVTLTPVNPDGQQQSSSMSSQFVTSMLNPTPDAGIDSLFETNSQIDVQASTTVASLTLSAPTLTPSTIATIYTVPQAPTPPTTAPSTLLIVQRYMDQRMNEAVKVAVQIQTDKLRDEAQVENEEFLKNLDENIQKIIKEHVKEQVKVQVSKILPKIEKTVNEQLETEVLTRSSNSSKTSDAVTADISEMELKKILIKKMEGNKSIHRSDEQKNPYKALVEAYESDKIILDTYGDIVTLKRHHDDDSDKDEEPSTGSDWGSKRQREGKEPESTSAPREKATRTTSRSTQGSKSQQKTASESAPAVKPMQIT